uniref:Tumor necrosis factor receptor superfamily, member 9a n=1 Tax=Mastacembelus armatus TaxID=205130 RepID=A0A3Q3T4F9_9TELE
MAVILWAMGLSLLMQGYLFSLGRTETGCMKWVPSGDDVCCEACHPGNRLVKKCGPNPKELCKPCERKTFTVIPAAISCTPCRQCIGALVTVKNCTATSNTICSCKEGLICGDDSCSFCTEKCDKGQEPTEDRSCRPCPDGMFSDQIQQKCKPWSTKVAQLWGILRTPHSSERKPGKIATLPLLNSDKGGYSEYERVFSILVLLSQLLDNVFAF